MADVDRKVVFDYLFLMLVSKIEIPEAKLFRRGKVRDVFDLGENLLLVSTDRLSAFDYVLPSLIPCKGTVLNSLALFWFNRFSREFPNHVVTGDVDLYPAPFRDHKDLLRGRSVLVRKLKPLPFEIIVRGYISGSGWNSYRENGTISGISVPPGMTESEAFPQPLFTPTTKADEGHDEPTTYEALVEAIGAKRASRIRETALELYRQARVYAEGKGIILADTKFEMAFDGDEPILVDEIFTPDSSRFWKRDGYKAGRGQESLDKQYVRNYLLSSSWDRKSPPPPLPDSVVKETSRIYQSIFKTLTGSHPGC